ncbi:replicative DNA helicase [Paenibacillus aquistagni]|uniref:Replicative DNA helicase n=1 Tax=Paenibacillus aquistagni TaxID=1852522 RepID=A0A1X7LWM2_9BACL|nr:replicative DNA helicase [Paenibacillus aquistagni]SMG58288.1 replicative DNA helicase [Paenibacillus aquistagni]
MHSEFYNLDAETSVLGSILLKPDYMDHTKLHANDFYYASHKVIFEGMARLHEEGTPIDFVTLSQELGDSLVEVGGVSYVSKLAESVPSVSNFKHYEEIIKDLSLKRKMLETLQAKFREGRYSEDNEQFISSVLDSVQSLADETKPERTFRPMSDVLVDHEDKLAERQKMKGLTGVKTASTVMDKLTGGYQKQDLIIVAARPSVGKTAYMLNDAIAAAKSGTVDAVGIISLEMPDVPVSERVISAVGHIDSFKIRTGNLNDQDWGKYTMARQIVADMPIHIDDSPSATISQIASKVKAFKKKHGRIIVFIDYLQLIHGGKNFSSKTEEVGYISGKLKEIARENDCPIVVISSLSRSVEQRQDKRPMMSDLRESGKIEYDADMVIFLYRDDYYNTDSEKKNIVEVNVAKGRNTGTGLIEMAYLKNFNKFVDIAS